MDSFFYHYKVELRKMKVVICISVIQPLSPRYSGGERFQTEKLYFLSFKQKRKKVRLPKMHCSMSMLQYH